MTVAEFIDTYYKPDRLNREPGTRDRIITDRERDLEQYGRTLISHHDCVRGKVAWLYADGKVALL